MKNNITIGLFGFGCVGSGLKEILDKTPGSGIHIKKICIKNRKVRQAEDLFTYNKYEILNDPSINVVVELIDNAEEAFEIVTEALKKGKHVVTANKKMVAEHFSELLRLQETGNGSLLYEGACCASIPIIRSLEEYYCNDEIRNLEGIVNGSTNFILSSLASNGGSFDEALLIAQDLGYAESDPTLDTGGFDAQYKLSILLAHAYGIIVKPGEIFTSGIHSVSEAELKYAKEKGYRIKLVASAGSDAAGNITAIVAPKFVDQNDPLYHINNVFNGVKVRTGFSDNHLFSGPGAGSLTTASAVLTDLFAIGNDYRYDYRKLRNRIAPGKLQEDFLLRIFIRCETTNCFYARSLFENIEEFNMRGNDVYITGTITKIHLSEILEETRSSFILFEVMAPVASSIVPKVSLKRVFEAVNTVFVG